jgi:type I restriction enzyme R subunit
MARKKAPELTFQQHIANFLVREHKYGVLEQADITDTEHFIAEDHLWAFLTATQADTLKTLTDDYGTDARDEVFKALRKELAHTPLWMLLRHGLKVRGLEFRLYYPKPRSSESAATKKYGENRITFRPHFYFGETNQEIDFVIFLNGLPIVALELKHEKNQTVHDAVAQFAARDYARKIFQHPFVSVLSTAMERYQRIGAWVIEFERGDAGIIPLDACEEILPWAACTRDGPLLGGQRVDLWRGRRPVRDA